MVGAVTDSEIKSLLESLNARGVRFELHEDRWRCAPRKLLSAMEVELLKVYQEAVHRVLASPPEEHDEAVLEPEPEQPEEDQEQEVKQPVQVGSKLVLLDERLWESVGVYRFADIPTHAKGDQHAARIIAGEINFERAVAERRATVSMMQNMRTSHEARAIGAIMRLLFE